MEDKGEQELNINVQPEWPISYTRRLTYLRYDDDQWLIGLPIHVRADEVQPPCFVFFRPLIVIGHIDGYISVRRIEPLNVRTAIDHLIHTNPSEVAAYHNADVQIVSEAIGNAIIHLLTLAQIPPLLREGRPISCKQPVVIVPYSSSIRRE